MMMVVAFSSLARIWGEYSTIHSPPAFFVLFFKEDICSNTLIPLPIDCRQCTVANSVIDSISIVTITARRWRTLPLSLGSKVLDQDQSTVAQRAETTIAECSLTSCV